MAADPIQYPGSIASFNGGLVDDLREPQVNRFGISKHFDIFSNPFRLTPYRSTTAEADGTSAAHLAALDVRHFQLGLNGKMYGLGDDGSGHPQIYQKTDPTTGTWSASTTGAGNAAIVYGSFLEWQATLWMFSGTTNISKYVYGTNTFTNTAATIGASIVTVAQSIVGADANMYMFYNNRVARINSSGTITDNVLTCLPSNMRIQSVCRWGTYLAIGMAFGTFIYLGYGDNYYRQ